MSYSPTVALFAALLVASCSPDPGPSDEDASADGGVLERPSDAEDSRDTSDGVDGGTDATDVGADASPSVVASQYCEETAQMFCDYYLRCGRMAADDVADCLQTFLESCDAKFEPRYVSYVERGMLELSAEGIERCREHLADVECDEQLFDLDGGCSGVWVGTQGVGDPCAPGIGSFVCKPGTTCTLGLDLCGTCKVAAIVGDPCGAEIRCEKGAQCLDDTCVRRALPGESCTDNPCVTGASCVDDVCQGFEVVGVDEACGQTRRCPYKAACLDGTCVESALLGESCADRECASGWCDGRTCVPLKAPDESCEAPAECLSLSCEAGECGPLEAACFPE